MKRPRKPRAGEMPSARNIGDIIDAAARLEHISFGAGFNVRNDAAGLNVQLRHDPQRPHHSLCKIVDEGPDEEVDYTDERYWVREVYCQNIAGDSDSRMSFNTFAAGGAPFWGTATNLAEIGLPAGNQHLLLSHYATFPVVMVYSLWDNASPPNAHHYFMGGGCPDVVNADGICYIDNVFPNTNFGGQPYSWAFLDRAANEQRILIHFTEMPDAADKLMMFRTTMWLTGTGTAAQGPEGRMRVRLITEDFDPCDVTWNTAPATAAIGIREINLGTFVAMSVPDIRTDYGWNAIAGLSLFGEDLSAGFGFEFRGILDGLAGTIRLRVHHESPLLLLPGILYDLECPGATTGTETTTSTTGTTTTTETTTSTSTESTTSTTSGTTSSTTSHTTTTATTPGPTSPPPSTSTTTATTTSSTTAGPTTSSNPCVCCPDDTPDQMDVTISGLGGAWCDGTDAGTWRLDVIHTGDDYCEWKYDVGGRTILLTCSYAEGLEEYEWHVTYEHGTCGCAWRASWLTNHCDGGSITPPYAGQCMDNGGGTVSWTPTTTPPTTTIPTTTTA